MAWDVIRNHAIGVNELPEAWFLWEVKRMRERSQHSQGDSETESDGWERKL